jgi:hypothetical protein
MSKNNSEIDTAGTQSCFVFSSACVAASLYFIFTVYCYILRL